MRAHRGITLTEVMVAGAIFSLLALTLFEGVGLAARLSQENAEYLAADAYAFDLAYKRSRESFSELLKVLAAQNGAAMRETISSNACPVIFRPGSGNAATSLTRINWAKTADGYDDPNALLISVDVEWGPQNKRHALSDRFGRASIVKSGIGLNQ